MPMKYVRGAIGQYRTFLGEVWDYATDFQIDDVLLPSIKETINWFIDLVPKALGLRNATPRQQINANIIFIAFWVTLSVITLGATFALVAAHLVLLTIGVWRWLPAFNELWSRFRAWLPIPSDIDIPLWRSE